MGRLVGGKNDDPLVGEEAGDNGLAAGDPPGQGDPENAISSWPFF
jgi:hypothetical protein